MKPLYGHIPGTLYYCDGDRLLGAGSGKKVRFLLTEDPLAVVRNGS
jgi:hypothetical protein